MRRSTYGPRRSPRERCRSGAKFYDGRLSRSHGYLRGGGVSAPDRSRRRRWCCWHETTTGEGRPSPVRLKRPLDRYGTVTVAPSPVAEMLNVPDTVLATYA